MMKKLVNMLIIIIVIVLNILLIVGCSDIDTPKDSEINNQSDNSNNTGQGNNTENSGNINNGNNTGGNNNQGQENIVKPDKLQLDIKYEINDLTVTFDIEYNNAMGKITNYFWEFGDNDSGFSEEKAPVYKYKNYGKYEVILTVTYENKQQGIIIKEIDIQKKSANGLRYLFDKEFGQDKNSMYYAVHITGNSDEGRFKNGRSGREAYFKDLEILTEDKKEANRNFSQDYKQYGLEDIYDINYGWTNKEGTVITMPLYIGDKNFKAAMNKATVGFESFLLVDKSKPGQVIIRCNLDAGQPILKLNIPYNEYDAKIHNNIALFTIKFDGNPCYRGHTVTFDGFMKK